MIKKRSVLNKLPAKIWECLPCRISFIILGGLLGLTIALFIFIDPILNILVKPKLLDAVNRNEKIILEIDNLDFSFFTNSLSVNNSKFTYSDSTISGKDSLSILTPSISFSGINWLELISGSYNSFDGLTINEPFIIIERIQNKEIKSQDSTKNIPWGKQLQDLLPEELKISKFIVNSGKLIHRNQTKEENVNDTINNFSIIISELSPEQNKDKDSKGLIFADGLEIIIKGFHRRLDEAGYDFKINNLEISSQNSSLKLDTLSFKPFISDQEFFGRRQYRGDRWKIDIPELNLEEVDFHKIFSQNTIAVNTILVNRFNIENFINKRLPADPGSDPKMPHELISSLNFGLDIGKLEFNKGFLILQSLMPYVERRALLKFTNINAVISNIGNTPEIRKERKPCTIDASAYLQNTGKASIKINLFLQEDNLLFDYKGSLEGMSAKELNTHLEVEDNTSIESGEIVNATFKANVKNNIVAVNIIPLYHNLKIKSLNKDATKVSKVKSWIGNTFMVRESNPDDEGKIKSANVIYIVDEKDAFLDVVWQALLKGLGEVVGF